MEWIQSAGTAILISELTEYELGNAFRFAAFRKLLRPELAIRYWADYESDRDAGRIIRTVSNLARIFTTAKRLSATYTPLGGHRSFDILHVAAALEMKATVFLTFDANQKKLALAEGLSTSL